MYIRAKSEAYSHAPSDTIVVIKKKMSQNYNNNNGNILSHAMLLLLNVLRKKKDDKSDCFPWLESSAKKWRLTLVANGFGIVENIKKLADFWKQINTEGRIDQKYDLVNGFRHYSFVVNLWNHDRTYTKVLKCIAPLHFVKWRLPLLVEITRY